jgi:hypothetical protein
MLAEGVGAARGSAAPGVVGPGRREVPSIGVATSMIRRLPYALVAATLAAFLVGCDLLSLPTPDPRQALAAEAAARQSAWKAHGITSYTFEVLYGCFCPPDMTGPFEVTVVEGAVESITRDGRAVGPGDMIRGIPTTIDAVFGVVATSLQAAQIVVTFDPDWDFPATIEVDPIENAVDDEFGVQVTGFRPAG